LHAVSVAANGAGLVLLFRGLAGLRAMWLPLVFVLFAVPIPAPALLAAVWKLQIVTAQYAGWMLYMIGEPALVSGDQILRATQTFQVIETCSGLRSIETLTMLTFTLIDLFRRRGLHALLLVLSAPAIAFALNGVRVLTLILNPHSELLGVHTLQGVTVLLGGLMVVYWMDGLLEKVLPTPPARSRLERASHRTHRPLPERRVRLERLGVLLGLGAVTLLASVSVPVWPAPPREMPRLQTSVDAATDRWPQEAAPKDYMFEGSVRFGDTAHSRVLVSGKPVEIFVGTANPHRGGGSPLSPATAFPGPGWHVEARDVASPRKGVEASALTLRRGTRQVLVWHWFAGSRGLWVDSLRALGAVDHSRFRRDEPLYVVRLSTVLDVGPDQGEEEARRLAAFRLSRVSRHLEAVLDAL
jgi:exosortase